MPNIFQHSFPRPHPRAGEHSTCTDEGFRRFLERGGPAPCCSRQPAWWFGMRAPIQKPGPPSRRSIGEEDGGITSWGVSTQPGDLQQHLVCGHRAQGSSLGAQPAHICGLFHSTAPHHLPTPHRDLLFHHHLSLRKGAACVNSFPLLSYLNKVSSLPQRFHTQGIFAAITSSAVSTTPPPLTPSPKGIAVSIKELLQKFKEKKE